MDRYGIVSAALMKNKELSMEARGLYAILSTYCNRDRTCYPSTKTLVNLTGKSRATVFRWLQELEQKKVISKFQEGRNRIIIIYDDILLKK